MAGAEGVTPASPIRRVGVLTFHRCINYGSYWQARCLVEGLRKRDRLSPDDAEPAFFDAVLDEPLEPAVTDQLDLLRQAPTRVCRRRPSRRC
jgi:hypothetical protein